MNQPRARAKTHGSVTPIAVIPAWRPLRASGNQVDGEDVIASVALQNPARMPARYPVAGLNGHGGRAPLVSTAVAVRSTPPTLPSWACWPRESGQSFAADHARVRCRRARAERGLGTLAAIGRGLGGYRLADLVGRPPQVSAFSASCFVNENRPGSAPLGVVDEDARVAAIARLSDLFSRERLSI